MILIEPDRAGYQCNNLKLSTSGMGGNGRRPVSSCNGYRDQKLRYKDERKESGSRQHPLYFWRWDHLRIVGVDKDCHGSHLTSIIWIPEQKEDVEELASHHYEIWAERDWESLTKLYVSSDVCTLDDEQL